MNLNEHHESLHIYIYINHKIAGELLQLITIYINVLIYSSSVESLEWNICTANTLSFHLILMATSLKCCSTQKLGKQDTCPRLAR